MIYLMHVPKTAGTAIRYAFKDQDIPNLNIKSHGFRFTHLGEEDQVIITIRDPLERFISAFNSRRRKGHPRYNYEWTDNERWAFERYHDVHQLIRGLMKGDTSALKAVKKIRHLKPLSFWLMGDMYIRKNEHKIFSILSQQHLKKDFDVLCKKLNIKTGLPTDDYNAHRSDTTYRDMSRLNIDSRKFMESQFLAEDYEIYDILMDIRSIRDFT